jgi:hypothetical protein
VNVAAPGSFVPCECEKFAVEGSTAIYGALVEMGKMTRLSLFSDVLRKLAPHFVTRLLCRFGWHGQQVPSVYHDEGAPLTECERCGAVDV